MSEKIDYSKGIYDARQLGAGRMFILGVQHMFAMFGATVLVPLLTGLSVSTTLLCAGLGTLLFHLITKKKVPAFLGSSFAYLGGFSIVAPMLADADGNLTVANTKMLPYACAAIAFSGSGVSGGQPADLHLRHPPHHEILPAGGHWPHYHFHRPDPGPLCYQQLPVQLDPGLCGTGYLVIDATSGARAWSRSCPSSSACWCPTQWRW